MSEYMERVNCKIESLNNEVIRKMEKEIKDKINSCEISINAKGNYSGKIKVYSDDVQESWDLTLNYSKKLETLIKLKNHG